MKFVYWHSTYNLSVLNRCLNITCDKSRNLCVYASLTIGLKIGVFGFQVSGFEIQVSGFRFQVSGFRFQDSGFRFQVSGFRFQVSGFIVNQNRIRT